MYTVLPWRSQRRPPPSLTGGSHNGDWSVGTCSLIQAARRGPGGKRAERRGRNAERVLVLTCTISRTIRSRFPFPRQEGTRGRCGPIGKRSRRPGGPPGGVPPDTVCGGRPRDPRGATGGCPPDTVCGGRPRDPRGEQGGCSPGYIRYAGDAPAAPGGNKGGVPPAIYGMRGTPPRPPGSSRAACDAPASRRAALLAGNLARPSYDARNRAREY